MHGAPSTPGSHATRLQDLPDFDKRNWIAGLEKGLAVIQAFNGEDYRLTAAQAARLTGLTRSAARRHLMTLCYLGFVATDGKQFWLTPKVLRLGTAYLHSARLPRLVQPFLQRITAATKESAFVAVLDDDELVYVARNGANQVLNTGFVLGARIPPFVSSAGMAILAATAPERVGALLQAYQIRPFSPFTLTDKQAVRAHIEQATRLGYALSEQQLELGVRGIAVALRDHKTQLVGAISVSVRIGDERAEDAVRRLLPSLQQVAFELQGLL